MKLAFREEAEQQRQLGRYNDGRRTQEELPETKGKLAAAIENKT
jgi:hypothetical protein